MAAYEFKCNECGNWWDELRAVADRDNGVVCPGCTSTDGERAISRSNFHLKGTGWERDGYTTHTGDALKMKKHKRYT